HKRDRALDADHQGSKHQSRIMRGVGAIFHIAPIRKQRAYVAYESKRWRNRSGSALARYSASPTRLVEGSTAIFVLIAKLYVRPRHPVGRASEIRRLIQGSSPEIRPETISDSEEVLARKWGSLFLGLPPLGKIYRTAAARHLVSVVSFPLRTSRGRGV